MLCNSGESLNSTVALITSFAKKFRVCYLHLGTSAFLGKDYFIVLRFLRNNVLELCSKFIRCNSSNFVIGASRGETHCRSALKNIFIYYGLLFSLHRAIPFLCFVRPPGLLARCVYPAEYKNEDGFYGLVSLYGPAMCLWLYIMWDDKNLPWLFAVWICYIVGFVIFILIIFGGDKPLEDKLDKAKFFGPNNLKMTLCLAPVILLLLLSTGTDSNRYRDQIWQISLRMALDLFDGVEMLEVIIEENEVNYGVPKSFEKAILTFVCISFILSPLQLVEIKLRSSNRWGLLHRCREGLRTALQIICVNCVFLGLRMYLWRGYGKDASIFIAKNAIVICLGLFEICSIYTCCGCNDW